MSDVTAIFSVNDSNVPVTAVFQGWQCSSDGSVPVTSSVSVIGSVPVTGVSQ